MTWASISSPTPDRRIPSSSFSSRSSIIASLRPPSDTNAVSAPSWKIFPFTFSPTRTGFRLPPALLRLRLEHLGEALALGQLVRHARPSGDRHGHGPRHLRGGLRGRLSLRLRRALRLGPAWGASPAGAASGPPSSCLVSTTPEARFTTTSGPCGFFWGRSARSPRSGLTPRPGPLPPRSGLTPPARLRAFRGLVGRGRPRGPTALGGSGAGRRSAFTPPASSAASLGAVAPRRSSAVAIARSGGNAQHHIAKGRRGLLRPAAAPAKSALLVAHRSRSRFGGVRPPEGGGHYTRPTSNRKGRRAICAPGSGWGRLPRPCAASFASGPSQARPPRSPPPARSRRRWSGRPASPPTRPPASRPTGGRSGAAR